MRYRSIFPASVMMLALTIAAATDQWPQFRGAQAGAVPDDAALPDRWNETENVVWKVNIPGMGWSSPIVWDDHVFITTAISAGKEDKPEPGLYMGHHQAAGSANSHRWMLYDIDFKTG